VIEGVMPAEAALGVIRLSATKRLLSLYAEEEIDDEDYETLAQEPGEEEDGDEEEYSAEDESDQDHGAEAAEEPALSAERDPSPPETPAPEPGTEASVGPLGERSACYSPVLSSDPPRRTECG
jgi:hypothetical protein